jgi:hypothetical protein
MKIKKTAAGNVQLLDASGNIDVIFVKGQYTIQAAGDVITIFPAGGEARVINKADVTHTVAANGTATGFSGTAQDLMSYLSETAFSF